MTYEEAKKYKQELEEINKTNSDKLKFEKTIMGLTPEHIRTLPEWKEAKNAYDNSFAELRKFNNWFIKTFKEEYAEERHNKRMLIK